MDRTNALSPQSAREIGSALLTQLTANASRRDFFAALSAHLKKRFNFDRLCINLYDSQIEMLTYFTTAEGTVVKNLSPVRPAESTTTVAGHVISTRRPVVITNFNQYFSESQIHPIAEVGLKATMAFPLFLNDNIIATLHCSFAETPDNIYELTSFLLELTPILATCLGAILSMEQQDSGRIMPPEKLGKMDREESLICHSQAMRKVIRQIEVVANLNIPVLILGETGTGKSMLAQYIHRRSQRQEAHFVKVNCPALSNTLFESELFGHAKGAFTGASAKRTGRFELAHGGTLFLDEIAELSMEMQSKLLQILDDSSFERVGESVPITVDARIVAATNMDIGKAIDDGRLRPDLYHRLSLCVIKLPPLRERREDIAPLCAVMASSLPTRMHLPKFTFTPELIKPFTRYEWPGNLRELRNAIIKIMIHNSMHQSISQDTVERIIMENRPAPPTGLPAATAGPIEGAAQAGISSDGRLESLEEIERRHIELALSSCGGV
ncbi:MAG: sigma-54-dependent Fis family transcriptional regulator, partial [Desulfovibrio sp.]|nr:sigma-54-dependent Fis family transcriptional regulator [Desulfovibrio sp.]